MNVNGVTFTIKAIDSASSIFGKVGNSITGLKSIAFNAIGSMKNMFTGLGNHIAMAMGIGSAGITATLAMLSKNAVGLASDFEQARIAFTGMLGSKDAAQSLLDTLQQFANVTPFEFPQLIQATRLLTAYGFKAQELIPTLTAVGDAVSGLGGGSEVLQRVMLAIGQIKSKGFLSGEEARQMAESGINAYQMVAEALGVSIPQAMQMSEKKIINADMALAAIVSGVEKRFPGMMAMQSQTLQGVTSTLFDVFHNGLRKIGETVMPKLEGIIKGLTNLVVNLFNDNNIKTFSDWIDKVFNRDTIQSIVAWFASVYETGVYVFDKLGTYAPKAIDLITKAFKNMRQFLLDDVVPALLKVAKIMIVAESMKAGIGIITASSTIAAAIPNPYAAAAILSAGIASGTLLATGASMIGVKTISALEDKYNQWRGENTKIPGLSGGIKFSDYLVGKQKADARDEDATNIVNMFMAGFDNAMTGLKSSATQTATNTGILVQQNQSVLSAIFGNGGDRMRALQTRARFGNLNTRGGGVQVNITVSSQKDADNLRYALQLAAAR